jgi:hypothetical protein
MTKKTIKQSSADLGLIFTAYNLKTILNLIDENQLSQYLKMLTLFVLAIRTFFKAFYFYYIFNPKLNHCCPIKVNTKEAIKMASQLKS